jgi:nitrogen fixation/metabolism regulation signal transduction histidine kinase
MTGTKEQRSRKNMLIMPGFQGRMISFVILAGFLCAILNGYLYYSYVVDSYDFILRHSTLSKELIDQRYRDLFVFGMSLGAATFVVILIIAVWALFITHRAAGSVYHIKKVIDEIRAGNVGERVRLRKKDEFQEVAQAFNALMDELQKR